MGFVPQRFAERGYNVFVQDVRGRGESGGEFEPYVHEADDGDATINWIVATAMVRRSSACDELPRFCTMGRCWKTQPASQSVFSDCHAVAIGAITRRIV